MNVRPEATRSLAARTYLLRNPRRVVPVALIHAMVTALLVIAVTPTNIFDRLAEAYAKPLESYTVVTPQVRDAFDDVLLATLDDNPHQASRRRAKMLWFETPAIIGELYAPLVALDAGDQAEFMQRMGVRLVRGVLPKTGSPGVAIHEALLRAREMDIGDEFGRIVDPEHATPGRFVVVGALEGDARLGLADLGYTSIPDFVLARRKAFQVVYAKDGEKDASDTYLNDAVDEEGRKCFRVIDAKWARAEADKALRNLPLVLGFITGANGIIVALVTALLGILSFQSRQDEFALFLAVGHRRARLVRKLAFESTLIALGGWVVGLAVGLLVVWLYDRFLLEPKAIQMDVFDARPFFFSLSVPLLSALVTAVALSARLRRMDPVAIIQRRGG